ncbi:concanavalin A-like lectin/glucanase domain-containing protein [Cercophora newfieldiana]|uniref:Concanavalin A-like lectin/glucanase domain-containing protein n=1 Tax=Cercophora newfieldiana TaxID=92897 RepID=A0AA40CJJ2_9PEZI|nr:concanavalin A-like lectin/glucanase domain-containing protein [Cercophora newfieldiana]
MRCLSAAFISGFLALAARHVDGLDITVSGTQNGEPIPASELTFSNWEDGPLRWRPENIAERPGNNKFAATAAANPTADSPSYCGSINRSTASNRVKSITGAWQHPNCRVQTDKELRQAAAPKVVIGHGTSVVLYAGSYCQVRNWAGKVDNYLYWEWYPLNESQILNKIPVAPGDWIQATIDMPSPTSAQIVLTNFSKQTAITIILYNGTELVGTEAIWMVEAPYLANNYQPIYPRFDTIWITEANATLQNGSKLGIMGSVQSQVPNQCRSWEYDDTAVELIQLWPGTGSGVASPGAAS